MNKSEIIAQAKIVEATLDKIRPCIPAEQFDAETSFATEKALISAARLLDMVEVVEEGSLPEIGDLGVENNTVFRVIFGDWNAGNWDRPIYPDKKNNVKIIQRNNRPVITITKGEV